MELGFMAYLAWQEAEAGSDDGAVWRERARGFLAEHLTIWLPRFCRRIRDASRHPFYAAVADLTLSFVGLDAEELAKR
jgi:TorA maturation chaperone TorD